LLRTFGICLYRYICVCVYYVYMYMYILLLGFRLLPIRSQQPIFSGFLCRWTMHVRW
jgi:hypothetical protein